MPDAAEWVLLAECNDLAELHALRATLEARGVPFRIQGEHTHGIMGPIHGAMVAVAAHNRRLDAAASAPRSTAQPREIRSGSGSRTGR